MPHCVSCSCSELLTMISHHALQLLITTLGVLLGMLLAVWVLR